jgi:dienelactone hydrolase
MEDSMHSRTVGVRVSCAVLMCLWIATAMCEDRPDVRKANWTLASQWSPDKIKDRLFSLEVRPHWIRDSDRFWYRFDDSHGTRYWLVDPREPSKLPLFDHELLASEISEAAGTEQKPDGLNLEDVEVGPGSLWIRFTIGEKRFEFLPGSESLRTIEANPPVPEWCALSPDGSTCVFARGNNLYSAPLGGDEADEVQLTEDGVRGWGWGDPWELIDDRNRTPRKVPVVWSPNSRRVAMQRADSRAVAELWNVNHLAEPRPTLTTFKYPMPGEAVPQWQVWAVDVAEATAKQVDVARWPDQTLEEFFVRPLWWSEDSSKLYFFRRSRDYRMLDLCVADPTIGTSRTLVEERLDGMVYARPWIELSDGRFLWWSIHDGWGHYGLYAANGEIQRVLTRGSFNVEDVGAVDEPEGVVFLTANGREQGRNPYYHHLYRVGLERPGLELLTPEDADHSVVFAPSRAFFVDRVSRVDQPTRSLVRDTKGKLVLELETADSSALDAAGWKPPEVFRALGADGSTELWGVMWKPFDFDPKTQYPVITRVYPGRMDEYIPTRFQPVDAETALSQLGSIVVRFGNRGGSRHRGLAYREYARDQFRDYGLADKQAVIEELAERFDFIDGEKVGIYGGSSGGFMTVSAMLVYPDFFKVGVAMNGPHDPSIQSVEWVERYAGVERVVNEDGTARWRPAEVASNLELADKLEGRLLLLHGAQDEIVPLAQHMRMVDAFIKADKQVDQFVIPGAGHGLPWRYTYGLVWRYFAEHLIEQ